MPPRPYEGRGAGQRGQRPNNRGNRRGQEADPLDLLFGEDEIAPEYSPRTNHSLYDGSRTSDRFEGVGLTAESLTVEGKQVKIEFEPNDTSVRLNEKIPGQVETLDNFSEEELTIEQQGKARVIKGKIAPKVATALIVRDHEGKEKVWAFNRPESPEFGRGESGPVGLLRTLPGEQVDREVSQEYFGVAKAPGGEEVIVAVDTGESKDVQQRRIFKGRSRVVRVRHRRLQGLLRQQGASRDAIKKATDDVKYLTKHRRVVFVKKKPLARSIEDEMFNVTSRLNGHTETTKAFVRFDERQPTIIKPVCIEPEGQVDLDSLRFFDADGERDCYTVDGANRSQAEYLQEITRNLGRPKLVQEEAGGSVITPPPLSVQLYVDPSSALPIRTERSPYIQLDLAA